MPVSRIIKYVFDFRYKMSKDKSSWRTCVKTVSKALSGSSEGSIFNTWTMVLITVRLKLSDEILQLDALDNDDLLRLHIDIFICL